MPTKYGRNEISTILVQILNRCAVVVGNLMSLDAFMYHISQSSITECPSNAHVHHLRVKACYKRTQRLSLVVYIKH